jgi:hypothetical protein
VLPKIAFGKHLGNNNAAAGTGQAIPGIHPATVMVTRHARVIANPKRHKSESPRATLALDASLACIGMRQFSWGKLQGDRVRKSVTMG